MLSVYELRRANLRELAKTWGGPTSLAKKLQHSNGSYLAQLIGPHPSRDVSEKTARDIERKLGLSIGWLDQEHAGKSSPLDDKALGDCVRAIAAALRDAGHTASPVQYGTLVELTYDRWRLVGRLDEAYIKRLMELMG